MNYIRLLEFSASLGLTSVTAYLIFKIVSAIQRQKAMMENDASDLEEEEVAVEEEEDEKEDDIEMSVESEEEEADDEADTESEEEQEQGQEQGQGQGQQPEQQPEEDVNMDIESEDVPDNCVYDDMPGLMTGFCPPESESDEMEMIAALEKRLLAEIELIKRDHTVGKLETNIMLLSRFEAFEKTTLAKNQAFSEVTVDKFHALEDLVEIRVQQLEKAFQQKLDDARQEMKKKDEVLENALVAQKESFLPLLAKKELDKGNWQGWLASSTLDGVDLEITIQNRSYNSYESNDAWVDATTKTNDSATYRDSLLGLDDASSWHISDSIVKRYSTFAWNGSTHIQVTLKNMPTQKQTQADARDTLKKFYPLLSWTRILFPSQTKRE